MKKLIKKSQVSKKNKGSTPHFQAAGRFVFGSNPVLEALRARPQDVEQLYFAHGHVPKGVAGELLSRAKDAGIRVTQVPREKLSSLANGGVHQGVVAEMREFAYAELSDILDLAQSVNEPPLVVVLDGIQDPHNLGAIIRSAYALGAHGVVIPKDRAVGVTGVVSKASAGATEHCLVSRVTNLSRALDELKEAGLWVVAADLKGDKTLWGAKLEGPLALVVGAEGDGIRSGVLKQADIRCNIPLSGEVSSLNASVSASLLLYEVQRQRQVTK